MTYSGCVRRGLIVSLSVIGALLATPSAVAEEEPPRPIKRTITLQVPDAGMAAVPIEFQVTTTPAKDARSVRMAVQVSSKRGWVNLRTVSPDRRGSAAGTLVSNRAGNKEYRAVVLSPTGRVLAASRPTVTAWAPLVHDVSLRCERADAAIGVDVPCTITVSPPVRLDDMVTVLQEWSRTDWLMLEAARVPGKGTVRTHVAGIAAGVGEYRAILMRDGLVRAESAVVTVTYSAPE